MSTLALWALPLLVVLELGSTAFGEPLLATAALALIVAGALFAARPPPAVPRQRLLGAALGALAFALGLAHYAPTLLPLVGRGPAPLAPITRALARPEWALVVPVVAAALTAWGWARLAGRRPDARDLERFGLLVALGFLALFAARFTVQRLPVLPWRDPRVPPLLNAVIAVVAALALVRRGPQPLRLVALLGAALTLRWVGLATWTPDPVVRDMLPLAHDAATRFAQGDDPYGLYPMQRGSVVPLTYLPGMWALHSLPRLAGLDGRLIGLGADAAVVLAGWWAASGAAGEARRAARAVVLGLSAVWLFSPSVHWNGIYAEPHPWWALLALTTAAVVRGRFWWAAALLALGVLTRHFALVFAPFVALALIRALGLREAALRLGVAGALGAAVLLAFVVRDPEAFWFGTVRWLVEYGPAHHTWFHEKYGVTGTLYRLGQARWLPLIQLGVVLVGLGVGAARKRPAAVLAVGGFTLFCFIGANGIVWDSFFLDAYALALPLIAARAGAGPAPSAAAPPAEGATTPPLDGATTPPLDGATTPTPAPARLRAALAALAVAALALAAGALAVSLYRSESQAGRAAAAERAWAALEPGTTLVDRADRRLAFVTGRRVFDDLRGLDAERDLLDALIASSSGPTRFVLVTRVDRDDALFRAAQALDPTATPWIEGRYRGLALRRPPWQPALPAPDTCRVAGRSRRMLTVTAPGGGSLSHPLTLEAGATRVLLLAAHDDTTVVRGRPTVEVGLDSAGVVLERHAVPGVPGLSGWVVPVPPGGAAVFATVVARAGERPLCLVARAW